jgi:phosphate/sulfate permease
METATSFVVSIATVFSIPLSTTHTITGAVAGPGLAEGGRKGINVKQWVAALRPCCCPASMRCCPGSRAAAGGRRAAC